MHWTVHTHSFSFFSRYTYSYSIKQDTKVQRNSIHCRFHTGMRSQVYGNPKPLLFALNIINALLDVFRIMITASLSFQLIKSILGLPDIP